MTNKKILYLDMDGVVADFDGTIHKLHPELHDVTGEEKSNLIDKLLVENPFIFPSLDPIEGAVDAVDRLFEIYEVYFLSTPVWDAPTSFMAKRIWISTHFGEKAKKRLILTHRKDLAIGEFLVDDRIKNGAGEFKGKHIHFGTEEFPNWEITLKYLEDNK